MWLDCLGIRINTTSSFDVGTLSFKIDQAQLGDVEIENLSIMWYDEENQNYQLMETEWDSANSVLSTEVTHFSRYMVVDKKAWFEAWSENLYNFRQNEGYASTETILAIDCSGSMSGNDPISVIPGTSSQPYSVNACQRYYAAKYFTETKQINDKVGVVAFASRAVTLCELTNDKDIIEKSVRDFYNSGGTNFDNVLQVSMEMLENGDENAYKQIVLLTDGGATISTTNLIDIVRRNVKVYFVGLGNSQDARLIEYADAVNGEFIKAYTADDLVGIYKNIGMGTDFDMTDTDEDGLPDAIETAGIRLANGQIIYTDPIKDDTDGDDLFDGEEINPEIRHVEYTDLSLRELTGYYFCRLSDPNNEDSDGDGYSDISDINPTQYEDYSFLNDEIVYISYTDSHIGTYDTMEASQEYGLTHSLRNESQEQKFRFKWCGRGYQIISVTTGKAVSVDRNSGKLVLGDCNSDFDDQIWEILPSELQGGGLYIRNKYMPEDQHGKRSRYLTLNQTEWCTVREMEGEERILITSDVAWARYGEIWLNYYQWEHTLFNNTEKCISNYIYNTKIPMENCNIVSANGVNGLLTNQAEGAFKRLRFVDVKMDGVCCEIIATYNAMKISGENVDFYKLASEFEYNAKAVYVFLGFNGWCGSDPYKIADCLNAYNYSFVRIEDNYFATNQSYEDFDTELSSSKYRASIFSYRFLFTVEVVDESVPICYAPIHTIAAYYDLTDAQNPVHVFNYNMYSTMIETFPTVEYVLIQDREARGLESAHYMVGYLIY